MYNIDVQVRNKIATLQITSVVYGVCNNSDYVVNFDFDEEWSEFTTKTMQINYSDKSVLVVFNGNSCEMPIISEPAEVEIGVFAGQLHTTTGAHIPYIESVTTKTGLPPAPTPDVYAQIIALEEQAVETANSVRKDADDGKFDGKDGKDGVTPDISASATVDNTVGTPSVNVTKSGTTAAPQFSFEFHNLKGEPGQGVDINLENGEGDYSLQQKTDAENQPLALGKWSTAEGRGQNFIGNIIDLPTAQYLFALRVIGAEEVTDNIFYYRPTTSGLAPNKIYSMSLVWENTNRAFSYGTNGTFCIYAYDGSSWVPITSTNYTTSFKINSMPLQNEATYYNITFKTESVPELREIVFAFGALSSKSVGFNTGKWTLYRLDDDVWTDISNRCPNFATVQFRGASDNAMNNWFNYAATDRGMIWRRNTRDDLSYKDEYGAEKWYKSNNIVIGGINADKIRENAVLWFPINGGSLSNTQGAYFYVKNASKSCLALLELDDNKRQIKDSEGVEIRVQRISDSGIGSQVLVYMGAAISSDSHTEGNFNNAVWLNSDTRINEVDVRRQHVEGSRNLATGYAATLSGEYNRATGNHTDVGGEHNTAQYSYQTVRGRYNDNKEGNLFEVGNGDSESNRKNAFEVHSNGTAKVQAQGNTNDSVAQKGYVDTQVGTKQNIIQKAGDELDNKEDVIIDGTYQCIAGYSGEEVHCTVEDIYGTPQNGFVYGYFYHYVGDDKYILIDVQPRTDLTNYVTNTDYATSVASGVVILGAGLQAAAGGRAVISAATEDMINAKTDSYRPIVPSNLDYAVASIVGHHVTLTQTQYDNLQTIDPNTYYYIIEE